MTGLLTKFCLESRKNEAKLKMGICREAVVIRVSRQREMFGHFLCVIWITFMFLSPLRHDQVWSYFCCIHHDDKAALSDDDMGNALCTTREHRTRL